MSGFLDTAAIREDFPVTQQLLYFDAAHQMPLSRTVRAAFESFFDESQTSGGPKKVWLGRVNAIREQAARLLGAQASEISFTKNTSEGLNIAANALPLAEGDNVLLVEGDHPNNTYAWLNLQRKGVEVRVIAPDEGRVSPEAIARLIDSRTRAISLSHVMSDTGRRHDLAAIGALCRERGIHLVVDAIQSLGTMPLDVEAMGISLLATGCHKGLLLPQGLGIFYASRRLRDLKPAYLAGSGVSNPVRDRSASYEGAVFWKDGRRFETGNLNLPHLHALSAALAMLERIGVDNIAEHTLALGDRLLAELDRLGIRLVGPRAREERSHILVLALPGDGWIDYLAGQRVRVSPQRAGVRVSFAMFNTQGDVDRLAEIIAARLR